ncbi:SDR family oxidoreductase [Mucilaginibacter sp. Bleaf8]|uniref:SDR family oxidoreductase n=1 Tax=Mucilaginibacter sp. Bleaf8 TaxID=2834430 RepID=UPI001BD09A6D|nr:SDR family oxidoreductase [Mucilaginibacter sp. Bleaf8]MBS7563029.1 SDR family oxidoreductase [Mucilaginibacter sp. Bleaf8]
MILVTGANGHFGSLTIDFLLKGGIDASQISALVRSEEKAQALKVKGINIILGDYNDYTSLVKAFSGIDKLLFVSGTDLLNRTSQHRSIVKAAKEASVKHVIYTSGAFKTVTAESPLWLFAEAHIKTEQWLKESGLTHTLLKNGLYMDYLPYFIGNVLETGMIYLPAGDGKISMALRSEMAEATATVLSTEGHKNKTYDFVGTEAYGYEDIARYISETTKNTISYISPTEVEFRDSLKKVGQNIPEEFLGIILAQAQGDADIQSGDLEKLIGRPLTPITSFLQEIYKV